jgi:hypothetical protein
MTSQTKSKGGQQGGGPGDRKGDRDRGDRRDKKPRNKQ